MNGKADLHTHTNLSDGFFSPSELIEKAKKAGLDTISITDHDSVRNIEDSIQYGKENDIEVIPGVEISTDIEDKEIHLLGYFLNYKNRELKKYLSFFRDERLHRAKRIVAKLKKLGLNISIDDVLEQARSSAVGRPHIAHALIKLGYVENFYDAFNKYLGDKKPAYERKIHVSHQSALKLISDAGGLSIIAHPGFMKESILMNLINAGVDGIEVIHPMHNPHQINFYRGIVNQYCLLETGGSDFHGGIKGDEKNLGQYYISSQKVDAMRKMLISSI